MVLPISKNTCIDIVACSISLAQDEVFECIFYNKLQLCTMPLKVVWLNVKENAKIAVDTEVLASEEKYHVRQWSSEYINR